MTPTGLSAHVEIVYTLRNALNNALYACMVASASKCDVQQVYRIPYFIQISLHVNKEANTNVFLCF